MFRLRCIQCGREYPSDEVRYRCRCEGLLEAVCDLDALEVDRDTFGRRPLGVWRYREFLPTPERTPIISLQEGGTPLHRAENLGKDLGLQELYIKNEGVNPTGSFKDRGMTVGVSKALELGARSVGCASTGNTSASLSAYSAKAGIRCVVFLPSGKIAIGKLAQAILHGAVVIGIKGNFDAALTLMREASERFQIYLLNSVNPWRIEGQKTEAFEIVDQLGWEVPDRVIVPVGNCGNVSAIWKGFKEFHETGLVDALPSMMGFQAEGAAPVARAFREGKEEITPMEHPETVATAIRIGSPVNAPKALRAFRESRGICEAVSDREILEAQRLLASREGIGVEPASAAPLAGLIRLLREGGVGGDERIVCVTTGSALKDPETVFQTFGYPTEVEAKIEEVERLLQ
jgi:threonine synthase